jgi:hypothetical protein
MKNLIQAYNLIRKYGGIINIIIELIVLIEESGKDKKLSPKERSNIMRKLWQITYAVKDNIK